MRQELPRMQLLSAPSCQSQVRKRLCFFLLLMKNDALPIQARDKQTKQKIQAVTARVSHTELEELRRRAIEEGVSEEALEEAIRTFAEKQENSGRKKLKVRGGGGGGIRIQGMKQA